MNQRQGLAPSALGASLGLALILAFAGMTHAPGKARAAEMECGALLEKLAKTGELPGIAINLKDKTVKIVSSQGTCQEPIEAWSRRPPLKPAKPGKRAAQPAPSPKGTASPAPAPAETPQPAVQPGPCEYRLDELWTSRVIKIEGISHWLARVFTVDLDGNRQVDNVKFKLKAEDNSERVISYFAPSPETPGQAYPALKLPDDSFIGRLCFGDLTFEKPELFGRKVQKKWVDVPKPDLAAEMDARKRGVPYKPPERAKKRPPPPKKEETPWELLLAIAAGLAVFAGGAVVVAKKLRPGQDDEDGEEDEEDEEDPAPAPARKKPAKSEKPEDSEEPKK